MSIDTQCYLNCAKYLPEVLDCPAAFFDPEGRLIVCTLPQRGAYAQLIYDQCRKDPDAARVFGAVLSRLHADDGSPLCDLLILDCADRADLSEPIRSLLLLVAGEQQLHSQLSFESNDRLSFLREILYFDEESDKELRDLALQHQYRFEASRAVLLFDSEDPGDDLPLGTKKEIFAKILPLAPGFDFDDLFDFLNPHQAVLLKTVPERSADRSPEDFLREFADSVLSSLKSTYRLSYRISIGSVYPLLSGLCRSYKEASFLRDHFSWFDTGQKNVLLVTDHVADYLFTLLPESYYASKFASLEPLLEGRSELPATLCALSRNNMNLQKTADELSAHRNTLLQRTAKLVRRTQLDPVNRRQDRVIARQYALYHERKTTIRAGVVIRGNTNIPTTVFHKLGELLNKNSGGTMQLEIATIGLSGNNPLIMELAQQGRIDIGFGHAGMLRPVLGDRIAVTDTPFLFDSPHQALRILNGPVGYELVEPIRSRGLKVLSFVSMGWRYFSSTEDVFLRTPEDMEGRSVRVMQMPLFEAFLRYLGARPYHISYDKLPAAVRDSLVDLQDNPYQNFYDMHISEKHRRILELNMLLDSSLLISSRSFWDGLGQERRAILRQSLNELVRWLSRDFYELTARARPLIAEEGVHIYTPAPAEERLWRNAASDFLLGSEFGAQYRELRDKIAKEVSGHER